ncbi:sporulation membrane protein YtrI [Sutcliffiella rhizosphaerae]|uniref:Sporulation membrane protein YtrI n=1 Tax=Sutcliffiella rhizosphaerae TaxID=2880967 RepID=A0ABN8A3P5_9BACI|nr:sporulation membrane protein YtrI [Sutcliffiella rhizosphaerae]CAG9619619.1 Sporulation membrane protein YtrI [Sutcliffiella rhizosphaerae]
MRVPPYNRDPGWQRFFSGTVIGAILGWLIFIWMYGTSVDIYVSELSEYKDTVKKLEERIDILTEDNDKLNEEKDQLEIEDFKITIINHEKYMLNSFSSSSIIARITEDLNHLVSKDLANIKENRELLIKMIENKRYALDDKEYYFEVNFLYIDTTIEIDLLIVKVE